MRVIILAGGGGTRLWPLSTENKPKQFLMLPGVPLTLFQFTLKRAMLFCESKDIIIVTSHHYIKFVMAQSLDVGIVINVEQVYLASKRLNTLPAILAGLLYTNVHSTEEVLVLPCDHIFGDEHILYESVNRAKNLIKNNIVIFGITPSSPHTGYGYINPGLNIKEGLYRVTDFKEKPDLDMAKFYISEGYYWNAGIFYFKFSTFVDLLKKHQPKMAQHFLSYKNIHEAYDNWNRELSIDYGLIELISEVIVSEVRTTWTDIGSFDSLINYLSDKQGFHKLHREINGSGSVLISQDYIKTVTIGLDNLIIVTTKDGLLICKAGQSQFVKDAK